MPTESIKDYEDKLKAINKDIATCDEEYLTQAEFNDFVVNIRDRIKDMVTMPETTRMSLANLRKNSQGNKTINADVSELEAKLVELASSKVLILPPLVNITPQIVSALKNLNGNATVYLQFDAKNEKVTADDMVKKIKYYEDKLNEYEAYKDNENYVNLNTTITNLKDMLSDKRNTVSVSQAGMFQKATPPSRPNSKPGEAPQRPGHKPGGTKY